MIPSPRHIVRVKGEAHDAGHDDGDFADPTWFENPMFPWLAHPSVYQPRSFLLGTAPFALVACIVPPFYLGAVRIASYSTARGELAS